MAATISIRENAHFQSFLAAPVPGPLADVEALVKHLHPFSPDLSALGCMGASSVKELLACFPTVWSLARDCPASVDLLRAGKAGKVSLDRGTVASLLAAMFLGVIGSDARPEGDWNDWSFEHLLDATYSFFFFFFFFFFF
jgi:hypothetical protein